MPVDFVELAKFNEDSRNFIEHQKSKLTLQINNLQMELNNKNTPDDVKQQKKTKLAEIMNIYKGQYLHNLTDSH